MVETSVLWAVQARCRHCVGSAVVPCADRKSSGCLRTPFWTSNTATGETDSCRDTFFRFFLFLFFLLFFSLHSFCLLIIVFAKWEMNESIFSLLAWLCCPVWLLVYGFCFTCRPVVSLTSKYGSDVQVFSPLCLKCCSYFSCQTRKTRYCPSNFCHINIGFFRKK